MSRPWSPCAAAGTGWTGWPAPSWTGETLEEDEAYAAAGISPGTAPAAIARGQAPGTTTAPGQPPAAAQASADHIAPAPSR